AKWRWHGQRKLQSACRQWHDSGIAAGRCGWETRQGVAEVLARRASSWHQDWARTR
ncbi:hypothetical protein HAX54_000242, partial [Datura stramonium]|nr:hypothetical protein [Datura stramonium]